MVNLGKCLLFYLKYGAEMERLYDTGDDDPNTDGLPNADAVLEKTRLVGDTACREAAELLRACSNVIEAHFSSISIVKRRKTDLEKKWELSFKIAPRSADGAEFLLGVSVLIDEARAALLPWLWCRGGRRAADEMRRVLGNAIDVDLGSDSGSVIFDEIQIPAPKSLDEDVAVDPIVLQVQQAFAPFTTEHVNAIAAIASNRDVDNE